ncbi:Synaptotagmin-4 [Diplonema papillatum]|nr:Synaptotagmin-4 [Diplonema papillatum]
MKKFGCLLPFLKKSRHDDDHVFVAVSAEQQAKLNEATAEISAPPPPPDAERGKPQLTEAERRKARRRRRRELQREAKLKTLQRAREVDALTEDDFNAAIRRLHSTTNTESLSGSDNQTTLPEGLSWVTAMLEVLWPSIRKYSEKTVYQTVQPILSSIVAGFGATLEIEKFDLGSRSPAFGPMTARRVAGIDGRAEGGFELSLGVSYRSDLNVDVRTSIGSVGVRNVEFVGTLFVWLRPFVDEMPLVGGVEMAFVNPPKVNLDWTGLSNIADFAGLAGKVRSMIDAAVASSCVVPNFIAVPLHPSVDAAKLACPPPEGIVRLTVVSARNLPSTDFGGGCDPYVRLRVGAQEFRTRALENTRCPTWNETFDFLVYNQEQWVVIEVLDHDFSVPDDLVGSVEHLPVNRIVKRRMAEVPLMKDGFPLVGEDADGGEYPPCLLQLRAEWIDIVDSEAASTDRLVSVQVVDIRDMPEEMREGAPFTVAATVDGHTQTTKPGGAKPKSWTESGEILRMIRTQKDKPAADIAQLAGLGGEPGEKLVARALEMKGESYALATDDTDNVWWKKQDYILNHGGFPRAENAAADERITWASQHENRRLPVASEAEIERRKAFYREAGELAAWHAEVAAVLIAAKAAREPYWAHVMHINAKATEEVGLSVLDRHKTVLGSTTLTVSDTATGDEADAKGPFAIEIRTREGAAVVVHVNGSVTVKSLKIAESLPRNWNLQADTLDPTAAFTEWWKDEVFLQDYKENNRNGKKWTAVDWVEGSRGKAGESELAERQRYYDQHAERVVGSGVGLTKEEALRDCLKAGSLTWGDYDVILGKLNAEGGHSTIAESLEWVNLLIFALWRHIKAFAEKTIKETVEPACSRAAKKAGATLALLDLDVMIPKADVGTKPPSLNTVQVEKIRKPTGWGGDYAGMVMTLHNVSFVSNVDVEIEVLVTTSLGTKKIKVGAKDVLFRATVKIHMGPMLPDLPMIGAVSVTLPNTPDLCIDFTGITDVVDKIPGMNTLVTDAICDGIAGFCCVPNFVVVPLDPLLDHAVELSHPKPKGVLRMAVESASNLEAGDTSITGKKSSDAYVKMRVGAATKSTSAVTSLDPVWTEGNVKDFVVHDMDQHVEFEVLDADGILRGSDDSLGLVYSNEQTLGGGTLVRSGVPVRGLLRAGRNAEYHLARKVRDEELSVDGEVVFTTNPSVGVSGLPSTLYLSPSWLELSSDPAAPNEAFLVSVQVDEIKGMPSGVEADLNGPFRVRVTAQDGESAVSKVGTAKHNGNIDGLTLLKTLVKMAAGGASEDEIAEALEIDPELVEKALAIVRVDDFGDEPGEEASFWAEDAVASVLRNKAIEHPQFLHRTYLVINPASDLEKLGEFTCRVTLEVLSSKDHVLGCATVDYNVAGQYDAGEKAQKLLHGPFAIDVNLSEKQSGAFSFVGKGKKVRDAFEGTWQLYGSVQVEGLRLSQKHQDPMGGPAS